MTRTEVLRKIKEKQREAAIQVAQEALKEQGIEPGKLSVDETSSNVRKDVSDYEIGLLYFLGYSTYRIASRLGLSAAGVKYRLEKMGIYEYANDLTMYINGNTVE